MGRETKIDWCDATWNPVTGCLHGCEYCYARKIAERFGGCWRLDLPPDTSWRKNVDVGERGLMGDYARHRNGKCHVLNEPEIECAVFDPPNGYRGEKKPYPYYFDHTFHRYKLDEPQRWKKPRNIFVCSMSDLFGDWVPDEWITEVFKACEAAPQHRYLFLTKNPKRYVDLYVRAILPVKAGYWYGATTTSPEQPFFYSRMPDDNPHTFASIEPIMAPFGDIKEFPEWVIIGAETGKRRGKVTPEKAWVDGILSQAQKRRVPIFMKESLRELMGDDFKQEFPWGRAER